MDLKWLGAYKIIKALGRGIYRVPSTDDPSQIVARVHGIHLKPYHPPDEKVRRLGISCYKNNILCKTLCFMPQGLHIVNNLCFCDF